MSESPQIQWFPGHMAKTKRMIKESISIVDCVAEVIDARIPQSSRNPVLDELCAQKPRILLLNKSDLADETANKEWIRFFSAKGGKALAVDCKSGKGIGAFLPLLRRMLNEKIERKKQKGMKMCTLRIMVAGIPNVGKSAFINRMAGSVRAKTEDRPGVTRNRQWITIGDGIELMDTPGILWPKFEDNAVAEHLAFTGAVKDDIIDTVQLASRLCEELSKSHAENICARYKLDPCLPQTGDEILKKIGARRGMLISGGEVDLERASTMLLDEFRGGKLGRITLELPGREEEPQ